MGTSTEKMYLKKIFRVSVFLIAFSFVSSLFITAEASAATATTYQITVTAGANGKITPAGKSGVVSVKGGSSKIFTIKPNKDYHVSEVKINGARAFDGATITDPNLVRSGTSNVYKYKFENITTNVSIEASFEMDHFYNLTVVLEGKGSGTVTSAPKGVNCGSDCLELYKQGKVITLKAKADKESIFKGWLGCSETPSENVCKIMMSADTTVTAIFNFRIDHEEIITIQGRFSGGGQGGSLWFNRSNEVDPSQVAKVIAFTEEGDYVISLVKEGSFSIEVEKGGPVGMIFVGGDNEYLGYLTLGNGIDSIPLSKVGSGVTTIDLQILTFSGYAAEPSHNPIGTEIPLTPEEQTAIAQSDDFLSSIVKNPDVDDDGTIDFFSDKFYSLSILYFIRGGNFGNNLTPTVNPLANIEGYRLALGVEDSNRPDTVAFSGPPGSGLSNSTSDQANVYIDWTTYFSPDVNSPPIPPEGRYTVAYKTSTLTFDIPDQSSAPSHIVLAVPTVTLNGDGTINKVNWVYRFPGGTTTLDPQAIIDGIELQIDGSGTPCASYPQQGRIYNSGDLSATKTEHTLSCQNLKWSDVTIISMAYNDVYDNHYVVGWGR